MQSTDTIKKKQKHKVVTVVDILRQFSIVSPDFPLYTFLGDPIRVLTPKVLDEKAKAIATFLENKKLEHESVILLFEPGEKYVCALFGCLYANVIAIPAYPPMNEDMAQHLIQIMENAKTKLVLTDSKILSQLRATKILSPVMKLIKPLFSEKLKTYHHRMKASDHLNKVATVNVDDIPDELAKKYKAEEISPEDIAYLQYTSGSTNEPKGVVIKHQILLENLQQIVTRYEFGSHDCFAIWLPPYHDMGLISGIFLPLFCHCKAVHLTPFDFLQKPLRWLQAMSDYEATVSGGPDFAYRLCVNKVNGDELKNLDLKKWRVAFCGAEKVNHDTFDKFYAHFKSTGLHKHIFSPCYGLAEAVVFVSGIPQQLNVKTFDKNAMASGKAVLVSDEMVHARKIVSVGVPADNCCLKIVNPETHEEVLDNHVGEIWVYGPNTASNYWNNRSATELTLRAKLARDDGKEYLRTGDLGFIHHNELFITGRIKDLIIINGLNHYPQDIEAAIDEVPEIRRGGAAAFSVEGEHDEELVIVVEIKDIDFAKEKYEILAKKIRTLIAKQHHVQAGKIIFVKAKSIPKTTSGKKRRHECKRLYVNHLLSVLHQA